MAINFIGLDTAVSGMHSNQKSLEVTGHNISNIGTPGYTRQQAVLQTAQTRYVANSWVEMGASVQEIRQVRHLFLDNIYRSEMNGYGYWEARSNSIKDLEAILGEPMLDGLQSTLNEFWNAWQELAKSPDSLTIRALVRQRGESLVHHMNHMGAQINKLQDDINTEIMKRIDEVNQITTNIAKLNGMIARAEIANNKANDYYDQRNHLVDQLSKLVKAEVRENPDGQMDIIVGGYYLVSKAQQTNIVASQNAALSHFVTPKVEGLDMEINVGEGAIKGLMEARGQVSGAKGSYDNGTPNTTADVTFAIDISNISAEQLDNLKSNALSYIQQMEAQGLNYNLRLITYDGGVVTNENFNKDQSGFLDALEGLSATGVGGANFGQVVSELANTKPFLPDANRYVFTYTAESINGDGITATQEQVSQYISTLQANNLKVSVITSPLQFENGDPLEPGWNAITSGTGGLLYDIDTPAEDMANLFTQMGIDTATDVNKGIVTVDESLDIISSVKKMLNGVINVVAREVNRLQMSGITLTGANGGPFFEPIEASIPMEMGNIRVAVSASDLNNIVASQTDANGDNTIALAVAHLRNEDLMKGYTQILSIDDYYQNIILRVGNLGYSAEQTAISQLTLVNAADNDRQSIMGVSLDEEMSNMIKFKYAYNAATKTIGIINEMLDTLIHRTGLAGR
ncbi:MAG: flagellar hook-associated protein FlgK [Clostridiaceae bacterium]|nr:flagellar hook-associated protein FlgK [Clostridiaceae bacterium]